MAMSRAVNPEFIERYQLEYQKNPRSRVFAPLAEAYRKMGLLDEAYQVAAAGVKVHPGFASGRVALAKILIDKKDFQAAIEHLQAAVKISPDNLLANSLLGETWIALRRPKEALKAYKMVLFIDPSNEAALAAVKKWEFLTADEYSDEAYQEVSDSAVPAEKTDRDRDMERAISLADALTVRNEPDRAFEILLAAQRRLGDDPELQTRLGRLKKRLQIEEEVAEPLPSVQRKVADKNALKVEILQNLLRRIELHARPARS